MNILKSQIVPKTNSVKIHFHISDFDTYYICIMMISENIIVLSISLLLGGQVSESSNKIMERLRKYDNDNEDISMVFLRQDIRERLYYPD